MSPARSLARTLFIDADDTLWENNIFYLACTAQVLQELAALGVASSVAQAHLDRTEQRFIPTLGYGPRCYLTALDALCTELLPDLATDRLQALLARVHTYAQQVLDPPIVLLPDVRETLARLRPASLLVLVTKGAEDVQSAKVTRSGLGSLFDAVRIVPEKHKNTYASLVDEMSSDHATTWMIGNSPRSDINPAIEAGIGAIYIPHSETWSAEMAEVRYPERTVVLSRFRDLVAYFEPKADAAIARSIFAT